MTEPRRAIVSRVILLVSQVVRLRLWLPVLACGLLFAAPAWSWGCAGHEIVALVAERHLGPHAQRMVHDLLVPLPISPHLERSCHPRGLAPIANVSTWADDVRGDRTSRFFGTGHWHFIDVPRHVSGGDPRRYCPAHTGCLLTAISDQLAVLRDARAGRRQRAEALMFIIHLAGDLHQPLHCATNNDLGGNCVPVAYFRRQPQHSARKTAVYQPNLHAVWDTDIIQRRLHGRAPAWLAAVIEARFGSQFASWQREPIDLDAWAWESHHAAEETAYGRLPVAIPAEPSVRITGCDAVANRLLRLHEHLGVDYQKIAAPVVEAQLAKAGIRLAMLLNQLWP